MASLQDRGGSFRFIFRYHGKQHFVTIGKVSAEEAQAKAAQVEYLLLRLIELLPGVGIVEFLQHDGKPPVGLPGLAGESRQMNSPISAIATWRRTAIPSKPAPSRGSNFTSAT